MPTMMEGIFGLPTMVGNYVLGAYYPDKPALQFPEPLSITTGTFSAIRVTISNYYIKYYLMK